uniref:Putative secreted peptide n=1 Tax=Anopheles braziliensis TaxID=58242 RepID=A0A2M3ZS77_9DIPT
MRTNKYRWSSPLALCIVHSSNSLPFVNTTIDYTCINTLHSLWDKVCINCKKGVIFILKERKMIVCITDE